MNKIFLLLTIFLFLGSSILYSIDIIECYKAIPESLLGGRKIKLINENDEWGFLRKEAEEGDPVFVKAEVDKKNYYLRINDSIAGCGTAYEIAIFLTKLKYNIVGINIMDYDILGTKSSLKFYKYGESNWTEITNEIFPIINIASFFDDTYFKNISKKINHPDKIFSIQYKLPRYGTKVIADLYQVVVTGVDDYEEKKDLYEQFKKSAKYYIIEIEYDYKNVKFYIAKKISGE